MTNDNISKKLIIFIIILGIGLVSWKLFLINKSKNTSREPTRQTITLRDGEIIDSPKDNSYLDNDQKAIDNDNFLDHQINQLKDRINTLKTKEIMVTDGTRHTIPLKDILSGGPTKDGIPSIDNPRFISIADTSDFLSDNDLGLAIDINGVQRFYPFKILVWHEIVNDTIEGQRVLITYCPLCLSGIVFDPMVNGERVEFGVSGKLWNSNLLMYDRSSDSLWSQILGEAVVGEMTGTELKILSSDQTKYGKWKDLNPQGQVLSKDTGVARVYGHDPYADYYFTPGIFFPVDNKDTRLDEKDFILGIVINGQAKAYLPSAIKSIGELEETFQGKNLLIRYEADVDAVRIYEKINNQLERVNPLAGFWFIWVAVHPNTELYK